MSPIIQSFTHSMAYAHRAMFAAIERITEGWFLGLAARFVFFAVLFEYYINSAFTKVGEGFVGFFEISSGAYFQIVPTIIADTLDPAAVPVFPYQIMVVLGTYMEFILPILIVIGLFSRLAALGMIGFVMVQSLTDIYGHGLAPDKIGSWFDRFADGLIADQRLLWIFVLMVIVLKGAGKASLDHILLQRFQSPQ